MRSPSRLAQVRVRPLQSIRSRRVRWTFRRLCNEVDLNLINADLTILVAFRTFGHRFGIGV